MAPWFRKLFYRGLVEYGDTVDNVVPVASGNGLSNLIANDEDLKLGNIPLLRSADVVRVFV